MGTNNKTCSLRLQHFRAGQEQQLRSTTRRDREMLPCRVALQGGGSSERTEPRRSGQVFFFFDRGNVERLAPSGKHTLVRIRLPLYPYQPIIFWSLPSFHQCRNSNPHWLIASNRRHRPGLSELLIPSQRPNTVKSKQRPNLQPWMQLISSDVRILKQAGPGNYLIKPAFNLMHAEGLCLESSVEWQASPGSTM